MAALRVRRINFLRKRLTVAESATEVGGMVRFGSPSHSRGGAPANARRPRAHVLGGRCSPVRGLPAPDLRSSATAAGLEDLSAHDLRHTAASLLVASGATVKAVQRMLGHASAAMTLYVYSGLFADDLGALADRIDAAHDAHKSSRTAGVVWARDKICDLDDSPTSG
jgi:hypothetical protein